MQVNCPHNGSISFKCFAAQASVTVSFVTTNAAPFNLGFAGFATELLGTGIEYAEAMASCL